MNNQNQTRDPHAQKVLKTDRPARDERGEVKGYVVKDTKTIESVSSVAFRPKQGKRFAGKVISKANQATIHYLVRRVGTVDVILREANGVELESHTFEDVLRDTFDRDGVIVGDLAVRHKQVEADFGKKSHDYLGATFFPQAAKDAAPEYELLILVDKELPYGLPNDVKTYGPMSGTALVLVPYREDGDYASLGL